VPEAKAAEKAPEAKAVEMAAEAVEKVAEAGETWKKRFSKPCCGG
jgi:hypothetical protein